MGAIVGVKGPLVQQAQVGLVDECCALQGMAGTLALEMAVGDVAEFFVDQRKQLLQCFLVARFPAHQEFGYRMGRLLIHRQLERRASSKDSPPFRPSQCDRVAGPAGGEGQRKRNFDLPKYF